MLLLLWVRTTLGLETLCVVCLGRVSRDLVVDAVLGKVWNWRCKGRGNIKLELFGKAGATGKCSRTTWISAYPELWGNEASISKNKCKAAKYGEVDKNRRGKSSRAQSPYNQGPKLCCARQLSNRDNTRRPAFEIAVDLQFAASYMKQYLIFPPVCNWRTPADPAPIPSALRKPSLSREPTRTCSKQMTAVASFLPGPRHDGQALWEGGLFVRYHFPSESSVSSAPTISCYQQWTHACHICCVV
ncbi:hypothetical protein BDP67DRAFT_486720 [Colletotrichum lupini]|nr:hypothetical protein BDP67DRAFT_486720 [Colletotrichum lupini]